VLKTLHLSHVNLQKLFAIAFRGSSLSAKLLIIYILSKYYSAEQLGQYSLFNTTIILATFVVGFDYYSYSLRVIIKGKTKSIVQKAIVEQFTFYCLSYSVLGTILYIILRLWQGIENNYLLIFFLLLISEHLSQELFRILNAIGEVVKANLIMFLRTGLWVIALLIYLIQANKIIALENIYLLWFCSSLLSVFVGFSLLQKKTQLFSKLNFKQLKLSNYYKGIISSFPFILCSLLVKGSEYSNRYIIDVLSTKEQVGIYSFYANFSGIIIVFVDVIFFSFYYPTLIKKITEGNSFETKVVINSWKTKIVYFSITVAIFIIILVHILLGTHFSGMIYQKYFPAIIGLSIGSCFMNQSILYHYVLYALNKDKLILKAHAISFIIGVLSSIISFLHFGLIGISITFAMTFYVLFRVKKYYTDICLKL
jgi:O-antigen/teichoic acid export membrane protein